MKIIAAFGQLANGKDEFCDNLAKQLNANALSGHEWTRSAFANAVKDVFCDSFGVDRSFIEKWKRISEAPPEMLMPVRQCLQMIGDGFRQIKPNVWIEIVLRKQERQIISDGRYINEAKAVKNAGGLTVLIYRNGFLNDDPNPSESQLKPIVQYCDKNLKSGKIEHNLLKDAPEGLEFFDVYLQNDGDLKTFLQRSYEIVVANMFSQIAKKYLG